MGQWMVESKNILRGRSWTGYLYVKRKAMSMDSLVSVEHSKNQCSFCLSFICLLPVTLSHPFSNYVSQKRITFSLVRWINCTVQCPPHSHPPKKGKAMCPHMCPLEDIFSACIQNNSLCQSFGAADGRRTQTPENPEFSNVREKS